jgi:tRNA(Ile)-lysidine synthase
LNAISDLFANHFSAPMRSVHSFEAAIAADWPLERWIDVTVLVAVSGGADSIALLRAVGACRGHWSERQQLPAGRLVVAHFNHLWRGKESDDDSLFVRRLCMELKLPVFVGRPRPRGQSAARGQRRSEDAARRLRYRFLADIAHREGARYVALAHTADDQAETVLQRVLRGSGLAGLAGMPRTRRLSPSATLIRPMLSLSRREVLGYLTDIGQAHREDSSNQTSRYVRNRIRHELLPIARELYPSADRSLCRLADLARQTHEAILAHLESVAAQAVNTAPLLGQPAIFVQEFFRHVWQQQQWPQQSMGQSEWTSLAELAMLPSTIPAHQATIRTFPGNIRAEKKDGQLTLTRPSNSRS